MIARKEGSRLGQGRPQRNGAQQGKAGKSRESFHIKVPRYESIGIASRQVNWLPLVAVYGNGSGMKRLPALDGLRGVLALVVVVHHILLCHGSQALDAPATVCVWIFFIMSGHVLARAYDGKYLTFLARRFVRLWPVYALCLLGGYAALRQMPLWSELFWFPWINVVLRPPNYFSLPDPPAWSLCVEAAAMAFMPIIAWFRGHPIRSFAIVPLWLLSTILLDEHFIFGLLFMAGGALSRFDPECALLEMHGPQWLGKISYSLYLSHWVVLRACIQVFGQWGIALAVVLILPIAWTIWWAVENPSIGWSRAVGVRRSPKVFIHASAN